MKFKDIRGIELNTGDLVLIAKRGDLYEVYITGITEKGFYVSCEKKTSVYTNSSYIYITGREKEYHNDKQYLSRQWGRDLFLIEKNSNIPVEIKHLFNKNQLYNE